MGRKFIPLEEEHISEPSSYDIPFFQSLDLDHMAYSLLSPRLSFGIAE